MGAVGINLERAWALSRFGWEEKPIPAGGWKCPGRVEMSALRLELLVRVYGIALHGQKHPPGTRSPAAAEKVTKTPSRAV